MRTKDQEGEASERITDNSQKRIPVGGNRTGGLKVSGYHNSYVRFCYVWVVPFYIDVKVAQGWSGCVLKVKLVELSWSSFLSAIASCTERSDRDRLRLMHTPPLVILLAQSNTRLLAVHELYDIRSGASR